MKHNLLTRIIATGFILAAIAYSDVSAQNRDRRSDLASWGVTSNPDRDCKFFIGDGTLLIHIPDGSRPNDLATDINITNAPRVLKTAKDDFTIQVQVAGRFAPGSESTVGMRTAYNGAGLVAVFDEKNVVTLARAVLQHADGKPTPYANFEMRVNGSLQRIGLTNDHPIPLAKPRSLRLERRGQKILGAVSTDGINWHGLEPKELQVGVVAISTSKEEFNPRLSKLQLLK